jgi:uroporphyrinogen decarboxylase
MLKAQKKSVFLDSIYGLREEKDAVPVWLMRQAGRYQGAYQSLRKEYSFHDLSHQSDLIKEVTLIPLQYLDLDALIIFSDILVVLETLGFNFEIKEKIGPVISPEFSLEQLDSIKVGSSREVLSYVFEGIKKVKDASSLPLIGFCGGPFTVASYLIEGRSSKNFSKIKKMMYGFPNVFKRLLDLLTEVSIEYLLGQEEAGVDVIQVFDTWAEILTPEQFQEFIMPSLNKICASCQKPVIYFCKGTYHFLNFLKDSEVSGVSVDSHTPLELARKAMGKKRIIQGNLDPCILYCNEKVIASHVDKILETHALDPSFIFNLGHGILPDIEVEKVQFLVDYVKKWKIS